MAVTGYTFNADNYCPFCIGLMIPKVADQNIALGIDLGPDPIGAIFSTSEVQSAIYCGRCYAEIDCISIQHNHVKIALDDIRNLLEELTDLEDNYRTDFNYENNGIAYAQTFIEDLDDLVSNNLRDLIDTFKKAIGE